MAGVWCRQKVTDTEAKLRTAVQDKNTFQQEKAALERELKGIRTQAEKLTKNMDKVWQCRARAVYLFTISTL